MRKYRLQVSNCYFDSRLLNIIQHPFQEEIARSALGAEQVQFCATAAAKTFPEPGSAFSFWEHVDIKYRLSDLDASPRRIICSCLLWLTEVTIDRAPLMYRPGSHRQIAAEMEKDPTYIDNPVELDQLPKLPYSDPIPLLAKKGQMTVCTTATIHGASCNTGQLDRKVLFVTFTPRGVSLRVNMATEEKRRAYHRELKSKLRPERRHIVVD
jgi:ectoine hydroxylase-related dioxygenase (phytanoyl-CoA dioxygenase family)